MMLLIWPPKYRQLNTIDDEYACPTVSKFRQILRESVKEENPLYKMKKSVTEEIQTLQLTKEER